MKFLILGGTTFFGKGIARHLVQAGHTVTLFTRGNKKPGDLLKHDWIQGDRNSKKDLQKAAATKWDVVIDNIAYTGEDVKTALEVFPSVQRYVLTSTVSVYRYSKEGLHHDSLRENQVDFDFQPPKEDLKDVHWKYARGKLEAERVLLNQSQVPWTAIRPTVVYGPEDPLERGFWYLIRLLRGGPLVLSDKGEQRFRLTDSEDLAKNFVQAATSPKTIGKAYNIAQKEIVTLREFVEISAAALKVKADCVFLPANKIEAVAGPYDSLNDVIPDISSAEKDFGFSPAPLERCLERTTVWFRDHWKGDEKALLQTRTEELRLAKS